MKTSVLGKGEVFMELVSSSSPWDEITTPFGVVTGTTFLIWHTKNNGPELFVSKRYLCHLNGTTALCNRHFLVHYIPFQTVFPLALFSCCSSCSIQLYIQRSWHPTPLYKRANTNTSYPAKESLSQNSGLESDFPALGLPRLVQNASRKHPVTCL